MREDGIFAELRRVITKMREREARKAYWILKAMWRLVETRVSVRQDPARYQYLICHLVCSINTRLKAYWWRRMEEARG